MAGTMQGGAGKAHVKNPCVKIKDLRA